jgi:hypothetical protein
MWKTAPGGSGRPSGEARKLVFQKHKLGSPTAPRYCLRTSREQARDRHDRQAEGEDQLLAAKHGFSS